MPLHCIPLYLYTSILTLRATANSWCAPPHPLSQEQATTWEAGQRMPAGGDQRNRAAASHREPMRRIGQGTAWPRVLRGGKSAEAAVSQFSCGVTYTNHGLIDLTVPNELQAVAQWHEVTMHMPDPTAPHRALGHAV